jgi:hypothetical protein
MSDFFKLDCMQVDAANCFFSQEKNVCRTVFFRLIRDAKMTCFFSVLFFDYTNNSRWLSIFRIITTCSLTQDRQLSFVLFGLILTWSQLSRRRRYSLKESALRICKIVFFQSRSQLKFFYWSRSRSQLKFCIDYSLNFIDPISWQKTNSDLYLFVLKSIDNLLQVIEKFLFLELKPRSVKDFRRNHE